MKKNIYNILKGNFLISDDALKNWKFLVFVVVLMLFMISSAHYADRQVLEIAKLNKEIKELKAEFVDTRSIAMKIKLESNIKNKVKELGLQPSENPPEIIKVTSKPVK
ncbi:MAG: S-adenosyl-methyltransferase [Lutibacter sp.]|nr:FtsL-like putative cell division protein [Lutibacter sp.]MCF6180673.1 S-adenosyl-methyltransferase [Lutibacter sp.]